MVSRAHEHTALVLGAVTKFPFVKFEFDVSLGSFVVEQCMFFMFRIRYINKQINVVATTNAGNLMAS